MTALDFHDTLMTLAQVAIALAFLAGLLWLLGASALAFTLLLTEARSGAR